MKLGNCPAYVREQNTSRRAVGFGNRPELVSRVGAVAAQEREAMLE
jgi:hypothetical protein